MPVSIQISFKNCIEKSNVSGQTRFVRVSRSAKETKIQCNVLGPLNIKVNLINDVQLKRDISSILNYDACTTQQLSPESVSWYSWGKDMLMSPFYCAQPSGKFKIVDEVTCIDFNCEVNVALLILTAKISNPSDFETTKMRFSANSVLVNSKNYYSHSSEGSIEAKTIKVLDGSSSQVALVTNLKDNFVFLTSDRASFRNQENWVSTEGHNVFLQVMLNKHPTNQEACKIPKIESRFEFSDDLRLLGKTEPLTSALTLSELMVVIEIVLQVKSLYYRLSCQAKNNETENINQVLQAAYN